MRVFIGGVEYQLPARWYFTGPGAQLFPSPHGAEASPYLKDNEVNEDWGEVTPYPRDPASQVYSGLDRGKNSGYAGQCYVGDPQWFIDGMLPADILSRTPLPFPACCKPAPVVPQGGMVLGGSATVFPAVGSCLQCPGGAPLKWLLTVAGGTGLFAGANGTFVIPYLQGCTWRATSGGYIYQVTFLNGRWLVTVTSGVHAALLQPVGQFACMGFTAWVPFGEVIGEPTSAQTTPYTGS